MPLTHLRTFRVRYYECGADGSVRQAVYLNYMQEAAIDASAAAGYDMAWYEATDQHWLIRETDIEYLHPLHYGDSVQVRTWVLDLRQVRSRRAYEFRLVQSDELVARADTDWVFLDSTTEHPVAIPPEMKRGFFPEGVPVSAPPRTRFPPTPAPAPGAFRMRQRVEWRDVDPVHHVNNAVYLAYLEDCETQAMAARGWPRARMRAAGFVPVARRYQIEYRQPGALGDELELLTWVSGVEGTMAVRHYTVTRTSDDALLAQARMVWGTADVETQQPVPIPDALLADLAPQDS